MLSLFFFFGGGDVSSRELTTSSSTEADFWIKETLFFSAALFFPQIKCSNKHHQASNWTLLMLFTPGHAQKYCLTASGAPLKVGEALPATIKALHLWRLGRAQGATGAAHAHPCVPALRLTPKTPPNFERSSRGRQTIFLSVSGRKQHQKSPIRSLVVFI